MKKDNGCTLCPRECGADRESAPGVCGCKKTPRVARVMLHMWEEPPISGKSGSGAVFFTGCPLGCVFCQNGDISRRDRALSAGREMSEEELADVFLSLAEKGAENIDLVSPTPFTDLLVRAVKDARERGLSIPVVWNTGGYEKAETVSSLRGTVDIFLTDYKFFSPEISRALAGAPDYAKYASESLAAMVDSVGDPVFGGDGMMRSGVIVRHLVLPGMKDDSIAALREIDRVVGAKRVLLSLMSQYTPDFYRPRGDGKIDRDMARRVTTYEYEAVRAEALRLGFDGFMQERGSATSAYTPEWD